MALSVVSKPTGYRILTSKTGTYTDGSTTVTCASHGRSTGDFIYIEKNQATGFWYVTVLTANTFTISEYETATAYPFINDGTFVFYSTMATGARWSAVHLPIVYKLQSTLWPTNSVDTARTVSSYANDNGYVKLTLSGAITSTVTELEFVKVTFTGGTSAIYQILTWYSNSVVTINLAYIGGITFTSVQYYYNNYHAKIRVYAGLSEASTYSMFAQKPYVLVTEQKCVPDSTGLITLNINEFVKQQIAILKNDTVKGTLINNLDAFCMFYISYAEAYDYSVGGYTLLDFVGPYTDDSSDSTNAGYAINADLPFKNIYSGLMTEYAWALASDPTLNPIKFLTPMVTPQLSQGQYFDLSFINHLSNVGGISGFDRIKRDLYTNGNLAETVYDSILTYIPSSGKALGPGVWRIQIQQSFHNEDRIDITLVTRQYPSLGWLAISETKTITVNSCSFNYIDVTWLNYLGGYDYWRFQSNSDYGVQIEDTTQVRKNIFTNWPKSYGAGADTIRQETSRDSSQTLTVRAEYITMDQINDLRWIMSSPLVQIMTSKTDKRTVIPNADSFVYLQQSEKLFNLEITFIYTDNLPSQSL